MSEYTLSIETPPGRGGISSVARFETEFTWDFMESGCRLEGWELVEVKKLGDKFSLELEPFGHLHSRIVRCEVQSLRTKGNCSRATIGYD